MALESTVIAKIGGGLVAVGASSGAGVYAYQSGFLTKLFSEETAYVVVLAKAKVDDALQPTDEPNHTNRNFKCKSSIANLPEDTTCEIYQLPDKAANKLNDLTKINDASSVATKASIKEGIYFKLKIKSNLLSDKETETITLLSTKVGEETKKYGEFTVAYKIQDNKFVGKTDLLIGQAKTDVTADLSSGTFQCKLKNEDDSALKDCTVHKFTTQTEEKYKDLSFDSSNIVSTEVTKTDLTKNKFVAIKLTEEKSLADLTKNVTVVYVKKTGSDTSNVNVAEFTFISGLAKDANFSTSTNTFFLS